MTPQNPTVQHFLEEQQAKMRRNFMQGSPSEITMILDSLGLVLKALAPTKKIKDLTIRQVFEFTHKEVEFTEEQVLSQEVNVGNPSAAGPPGGKEEAYD